MYLICHDVLLCIAAQSRPSSAADTSARHTVIMNQQPLPTNFRAAVPQLAALAHASTSSVGDDRMPANNQVGHSLLTSAVPQHKRVAQQPLPQRYQAAAPSINRAVSSSNNNSYMIKINIKRGIPHRTCFAIEFIPGRQRYLSVSQFVNINLDLLRETLQQHVPHRYKLQVCVEAEYRHSTDTDKTKKWHLSTPAATVEDLSDHLQSAASSLDDKIAQYSALGSGWKIERVITLSLVVAEFSDLCRLGGRCGIDTPVMIRNKWCCTNVQNTDNKCFLYAVLAALKHDVIPDGQRHRPSVYTRYLAELKYKDEDMPMRLINIPTFERHNPQVAINIIKYTPPNRLNHLPYDDAAEVFKNPCFDLVYKSKQNNVAADAKVVHLLLVDNSEGQFHYLAITKLNRLLNCHKNDLVAKQIRSHVCHSCLRLYCHQTALDKHIPLCKEIKLFGTVFTPPEKTYLEFDQLSKTIPPKYIVYADFEATLEKPASADDEDDEDDARSVLQLHLPIAAGSLTIGPYGDTEYKQFYGEECIVEFLKHLETLSKEVFEWYEACAHRPMRPLYEVEENEYDDAENCYLCKKQFTNAKSRQKVHDHDHFTGDFLGAACNACNLARRVRKPFLPVVFHNFRGYDVHHLLKHAAHRFSSWEFSCIAQSSEKFQTVTAYIGKGYAPIRFIDSLQFLLSSLMNLGSMLQTNQKQYLNSLRNELPEEARTGKGIFPYSFVTGRDVLDEPRTDLPPREEAFYDTLSDSVNVSEDDFQRARTVWRLCGCTSLKDYMLIYLKVDVFLLADVFETFRSTARQEDGLDPANFLSIPGLSWCAALRSMSRSLDLLQDLEMYTFFESGIRGGMTFVNRHYACRNADTELLYIDINNLYGWALSQRLPARGFSWILEQDELNRIINSPLPDENAVFGLVLEVDISVPVEWHDRLSDLPPAPRSQVPTGSKAKKLLLTLEPKKNYVIHSALLKFYMENLGVKVDCIHRAVKFSQEFIFKNYIDKNTSMRAQATEKFKKDYYKLKNNALYGKTVENLRKRKDVRLCNNRTSFVAQSSKPTYRRCIIIKENLVAAVLNKETICLDRPVYVGQAVLDLSKLRMYKLQYQELQKYREQYAGSSINIVAGDTDSFFLEVKGISLANQLLPQMRDDGLLDTSNYPVSSALYSRQFENKIGLFKDESGGIDAYKEWIFLRPKCYSMLSEDESSIHKAKGVTRGTKLTHQQYADIFKSFHPDLETPPSPKRLRVEQRRIGSVNHEVFTSKYSKLALSITDDKRAWIGPNSSVPYGHYCIHN
jgi:DNA polymerase type B, organellar and viral/Recombination endonuclease VII